MRQMRRKVRESPSKGVSECVFEVSKGRNQPKEQGVWANFTQKALQI